SRRNIDRFRSRWRHVEVVERANLCGKTQGIEKENAPIRAKHTKVLPAAHVNAADRHLAGAQQCLPKECVTLLTALCGNQVVRVLVILRRDICAARKALDLDGL